MTESIFVKDPFAKRYYLYRFVQGEQEIQYLTLRSTWGVDKNAVYLAEAEDVAKSLRKSYAEHDTTRSYAVGCLDLVVDPFYIA